VSYLCVELWVICALNCGLMVIFTVGFSLMLVYYIFLCVLGFFMLVIAFEIMVMGHVLNMDPL